ncbi:MAG: 4-phosphoerythronate dehydrogenase [Cellvibrionaceae bacterium]
MILNNQTNNLRIVADENIPFVREFFRGLGSIETYPGRTLSSAQVMDADVLLVRSVTPVNETLLAGSSVKFVGTCTIGTDHLDIDYLDRHGIAYASAPGCNANSVVEYVFSVLAQLKPQWSSAKFGVVGCGNVGGSLYRRLKQLDLCVDVYDPFLDSAANPNLQSLEQVLSADVICLHTPHTNSGPFPSYHLLHESRLQQLPKGCLLINAGRGPAIDNQALKRLLKTRPDLTVALDVWEPEPELDTELMDLVQLSSPHIAGYSFDGKVEGTAMIYRALCATLGCEPQHNAEELLRHDQSNQTPLNLADAEGTCEQVANQAITMAYDVRADDRRTRDTLGAQACRDSNVVLAKRFDQLRKAYPKRREFPCFTIDALPRAFSSTQKKSLSKTLATLGFILNCPSK